jgi:carotenoid cleavage dioxygenase-like enzyme
MSMTEDLPMFLRGNGAPVKDEQTLTGLTVTGTIPPELDGRYLRNGGNPITGMTDHPFLGDGMVHGVRLRGGRAEWYRNRYVQTPFIADPDRPVIDTGQSLTDMTSSKANTNVIGHAGKIMALEEGHFPYVLDGLLETVGPTDFDGRLAGPFTAHPKICPATGELLAFGYSFLQPHLTYHRISADGVLVQSEEITVGGPTMVHDFNVTRNYIVIMDLPAVFDFDLALRGEMPITWSDAYRARLGVMPRNGNDASVRWFDINPCYVFHPLNAYEDGDTIVVDVSRRSHIWRDGPMDFPPPELYRWTIDLVSGHVSEEQIDDRPAEFPRVADAVVGQRHRFGYLVAVPEEDAYADAMLGEGAIIKYDCEAGQQQVIDLGRGRLPSEAVFVPSARGSQAGGAEDDGYLMTYVYDAATDASELAIFDAASMSNEAVARVHLPRVPFGFHGNWVDESVAN